MSEQINSGQVEEAAISASGLLLSVEPLQAAGGAQLDASDGNADTGGPGEKDTSDDMTGTADADGSDESGTATGADTDLTDALGGGDADSSDEAADTDSSDDSDAEIKMDGKDA